MRFIQALFLFLVVNCIAHANNDQSKKISREILQLIPHAIDRIENDRIFLKPEKVVSFEGKFYVEGICFPMLNLDESGWVVEMGSRPSKTPEERAFYICAKCTLVHYYKPTICERSGCGGRDFLVRYR